MQIEPFEHKTERPLREVPVYNSALNVNDNLVLSIDSMEMRRRMIPWKDADYYAKKSRYLWHINVALGDFYVMSVP